MLRKALKSLLLLHVWVALNVIHSEAALANVQEFRVLCRLKELAELSVAGIDKETGGQEVSDVLEKVLILTNLTNPGRLAGEGLEEVKSQKLKTWLEEHPLSNDNDSREAIRRGLKPLLAKVKHLEKEQSRLNKDIEDKTLEVQKSLGRVLYGELIKQNTVEDIHSFIKSPTGLNNDKTKIFNHESTETDSCGNTGDRNAGKTLINDLFCVCVGATAGIEQACHKNIKKGDSWTQAKDGSNSAKGTVDLAWAHIKTQCPPTNERLTPHNIATALSAFHGLLGRSVGSTATDKGAEYIFGTNTNANSNACPNSSSESCVNYKNVLTTGQKRIEWVFNFRQAQTSLEEIEKDRRQIHLICLEAAQLEALLEVLLSQRQPGDRVHGKLPGPPSNPTGKPEREGTGQTNALSGKESVPTPSGATQKSERYLTIAAVLILLW